MYLELADKNCDCKPNITIPVRDTFTGQILFFNREALAELNNEELNDVIQEAPYLMQKIAEANGNNIDFSEAQAVVMDTISSERSMSDCGPMPSPTRPGDMANWAKCTDFATLPPTKANLQQPNTMGMPQGGGINPKWGINIGVEPDPKPWFARTEVLVAAGAIVLGGIYLLKK